MINTTSPKMEIQKSNLRRKCIKYSGYTALAGLGVCALTGIKQINIPHKAKLHKYCAFITCLSALIHLGGIKKWDNLFIMNKEG